MVDMGISIRKKLIAMLERINKTFCVLKDQWNQLTNKQKNLILASGISIFAIFIWLQYGFLDFPLTNDMGIYLYGGRELLEGNLPYVNVFDVKPPMTFIVSGGGLLVFSNTLGLSPIVASRITMLLLGAGTIIFTYLLAYRLFKDRTMGILTAVILLSFTGFGWASLSGRPGIVMIFFTISCLYALLRKKWLIAGILATMSAIAWQPGAIYPFIVIFYSLFTKGQRKEQFKKAIVGISLPILAVVLYFFVMGGLQEMINQTVLFVLTYKQSGPWGSSLTLLNLGGTIFYDYGTELLFFACSFFGFILLLYNERKQLKNLTNPLPFLLFAFLPLALYSLVDFQGWPDMIPLLPYIAIFAAYFLIKTSKKIGRLFEKRNCLHTKKATIYVILIVLICSTLYGTLPKFAHHEPVQDKILDVLSEKGDLQEVNTKLSEGKVVDAISIIANDVGIAQFLKMMLFTVKTLDANLSEQIDVARYIEDHTNSTQRSLFIGNPEILFLSNRKNFDRYVLYPADILYMKKNGKLSAFIEKVMKEKPPIIVLSGKSSGKNNTSNLTGFYLPPDLNLSEFINREYEKTIQTKNYVLFQKK